MSVVTGARVLVIVWVVVVAVDVAAGGRRAGFDEVLRRLLGLAELRATIVEIRKTRSR